MKCIAWLIIGMFALPVVFVLAYMSRHLSAAAWVQIAIVVGTGLTAYLVGSKNRAVRRVGFVFGVTTQPFWFLASYWSGQWGVCLTCFWYVYCHGRGFVNTKN
jgi:hypothetical protein